jgi:hypothetical protein
MPYHSAAAVAIARLRIDAAGIQPSIDIRPEIAHTAPAYHYESRADRRTALAPRVERFCFYANERRGLLGTEWQVV